MSKNITEGVPFQLHQLYQGSQITKHVGQIWPALQQLQGVHFVGIVAELPHNNVEVTAKQSLYQITNAGVLDCATGQLHTHKFLVVVIEGIVKQSENLWSRFILDKFRQGTSITVEYNAEKGLIIK